MKRFAFALWLSAISLNAYADSANCYQKANTPESIAATMDQALQLKQQLNSQPDPVVILVRQGQDMSSRHLTWSHAGYAMRQPNGDWRVYHNLNTCGTAESALYIQGLYEFLADDLVNQSIAVLRPRSDIATALQTLLHSAIKLNLFHSPRYNLIAWPFSGPYQNSNGWLLEVFARANDAQVWSRNDARRWLQLQGYQPSIVSAGTFERLGAKLFTPNVFTDDQPAELLRKGNVGLNSGDSVIRFIAHYSRAISGCEHQNLGESVCVYLSPGAKK
ncbi:DUF2145 domain-containing protein [Salmonella enterica subsp. enterica serovar Tamberma]|uniref:DUF2145 domain-containing protein n=1 Tax=Salmonella enterica subsp. enterica serovar Tamberma TaxID=2565079 RepID=A0A5X9FBB9_SALET|nr:DUF2145 domain-containing protein [Salmonella enterica subsp. enterica serovar Tamberma]ECB2737159.1 DUF2145 domain-containing protein [Salmonella enterica subsp. enterica serovar Tamberma]